MPRVIFTATGEGTEQDVLLHMDGSLTFTSDGDIDTDGSGPLHGDPYAQPHTTLKIKGRSLNADLDKFIVLPPAVIKAVRPIVLGCLALIENKVNGKFTPAVVGDVGPKRKLGEMSVACAKALGIPWSPVTGGTNRNVIKYTVWPGIAARFDRTAYSLQPYREN